MKKIGYTLMLAFLGNVAACGQDKPKSIDLSAHVPSTAKINNTFFREIKPEAKITGKTILIYTNDSKLISFNLSTQKINWVGGGGATNGNHQFVLENGTLYTTFINGLLAAISANTGDIYWQNEVLSQLDKRRQFVAEPVLIDDNKVFALTKNIDLYAFDKRIGKEIWSKHFDMDINVISSAIVQNALFVSIGSRLVKLDKQAGKMIWEKDLQANIATKIRTDGNNLFVGTTAGILYVVKTDGLKPVLNWQLKLPDVYKIDENILLQNNMIYLNATQRPDGLKTTMYAIDAIKGKLIWNTAFAEETVMDMSFVNNQLYGCTKNFLFHIDTKTGKQLLKLKLAEKPLSNLIKSESNILYLSQNGLVNFNINTKKILLIPIVETKTNSTANKAYIQLIL